MASDDEISLVMATESGDVESVQGKAITRISDLVSEKSDGRITIDVFYQDQLGGPQELFDQLVMGNVDLMLTWPHTSYDERLGVLHLPYLTLGWDDALNAYSKDGWLSEIVQPILGDMGLEYLGPFPEGFGGIATRGKYATTTHPIAAAASTISVGRPMSTGSAMPSLAASRSVSSTAAWAALTTATRIGLPPPAR
ncbi:MAG: hypothetical protein VX796_14495 [Pseudomonadota bacterium]|nr:hypothetical protein [Pseudomonadota bacterium]MED5501949.1 hypothetical protein [Pseudomonadota bacterium]